MAGIRLETGKRKRDSQVSKFLLFIYLLSALAGGPTHTKMNKTRIAARMKAYYARNRRKIAAQQKIYSARNRRKIAARKKAYATTHKAQLAAYQRAYRAKMKGKKAARK